MKVLGYLLYFPLILIIQGFYFAINGYNGYLELLYFSLKWGLIICTLIIVIEFLYSLITFLSGPSKRIRDFKIKPSYIPLIVLSFIILIIYFTFLKTDLSSFIILLLTIIIGEFIRIRVINKSIKQY